MTSDGINRTRGRRSLRSRTRLRVTFSLFSRKYEWEPFTFKSSVEKCWTQYWLTANEIFEDSWDSVVCCWNCMRCLWNVVWQWLSWMTLIRCSCESKCRNEVLQTEEAFKVFLQCNYTFKIGVILITNMCLLQG